MGSAGLSQSSAVPVSSRGTRGGVFSVPRVLFLNTRCEIWDNNLPTARLRSWAGESAALGGKVSCWKHQHCLCLVLWSGDLCCSGLGWCL